MHKPINTLDKLLAENMFFYNMIEDAEIIDNMTMYSPGIEIRINMSLDDTDVPFDIMKAIHTKFYTRNEDEC